jgi:hypothetical protein
MRMSVLMENVMNDINVREPIPLAPAVVAVADPVDGLIKTIDLNTSILVAIRVWEAAEPGYYFQLMLDGGITGEVRVVTAEDHIGDMASLYLDKDLLRQNGTYTLGYRITSPNTEVSVDSPTIPLKVDRTPPGATLLAPMIFPTASFGDQLIGLVPGYAGMEPGDLIQTLCNGTEGPAHTVQADELTLRPIEVAFEREFLQGLNTDSVLIEYQVTDRAGNPSVTSLPVLMTVNL